MRPHLVEHNLHIVLPTVDRQHSILFGHHHTILPKGTVAAIGTMLTAPELVAIALSPIQPGLLAGMVVGDMFARCLFHPLCGDNLLALPNALLQIHLPKAGDLVGLDAQAPAAHVDPLGAAFPGGVGDAQWLKEARGQIFEQCQSGQLLHNCRAHIGGRAVVDKEAARCFVDGGMQKCLDPIAISLWRSKPVASTACPVDIESRWRTFIAARLLLTLPGNSSGKKEITGVVYAQVCPSATASPTAVEAKLLLSEKSTCGCSGA